MLNFENNFILKDKEKLKMTLKTRDGGGVRVDSIYLTFI